jgi:hypothetical protein
VPVAQICRLRVAEVSTKALYPTEGRRSNSPVSMLGTPRPEENNLQSDRIREVHKATVCNDPRRAETRYDNLFLTHPRRENER